MKLAALLLALLLAGCATGAADPYGPEATVRCPNPKPVLRVWFMPLPAGTVANTCLALVWKFGGKEPGAGLQHGGCSRYFPEDKTLYIWAEIPEQVSDLRRMSFIGHELLHGVCDEPGRAFHD